MAWNSRTIACADAEDIDESRGDEAEAVDYFGAEDAPFAFFFPLYNGSMASETAVCVCPTVPVRYHFIYV